MKELWVKKTVWELHLIEDSDTEEVKSILENDSQESYDIVVDTYDKSKEQNFDDNKLVLLQDNHSMKTMMIQDEYGKLEWVNMDT